MARSQSAGASEAKNRARMGVGINDRRARAQAVLISCSSAGGGAGTGDGGEGPRRDECGNRLVRRARRSWGSRVEGDRCSCRRWWMNLFVGDRGGLA